MIIKDKKIAIVGGGPGGLTLARLLQLKGCDVTVFERDAHKDVRNQGTTLDLHEESGLAALEKAGLMDAFKANYRPGADKIKVADNTAAIHYDEHAELREEIFGGKHFRPEIDRGPLRDILLNSLQPGTIVWDSQFIAMEKLGEGWLLHFKNKSSFYADIVIGADGANSKIRPYITPIKPFYAGVSAIEGHVQDAATIVPEMNALLNGGKIFAFGGGKVIIVSSKGDGSLAFYTSFRADESWIKNGVVDFANKAEVLSWFGEAYSDWDSAWTKLLEHAELPFIPRPIYCAPLDQAWQSLSNLTILGDAAHLMPPFAGEGVNMAMLDALKLSECLTSSGFDNIGAAISHYEKEMLQRSSIAAQESLENTGWMHNNGALEEMLRMFNGM